MENFWLYGWTSRWKNFAFKLALVLCHSNIEITEHLLLMCPWTDKVWTNPSLKMQPLAQGITGIDKWLMNYMKTGKNSPLFEMIVVTLWQIWKSRNNMIFPGHKPEGERIVQVTESMFRASIDGVSKRGR